MNEFVEKCRREWKRLHVPEPIADEMAADLAADLEEAAAEGVSPEEVLGGAAFDPRSFAASWAAARGVGRPATARLRVILAAFAALAAMAVSGAAVAVFAPPSGSVSAPANLALRASPHWKTAPPPNLRAGVPGVDTGAIGVVVLIVGLAVIVLLTLLWWRLGPGRSRGAYLGSPLAP